mgnify:CR=1 FL=1|jgi:elongation factor 3
MGGFDCQTAVLKQTDKASCDARLSATKAFADALQKGDQDAKEAFATDSEALTAILINCGDKNSQDVCKASQELLETAAKTVNEHAVLNYVDGLIQAMDSSNRAGTIAGALDFISRLAETSPHGVSCNLVRLMPMVTGLVNDASSVVAEAARTTVEKVCHTIDNRDIEPFIDDMVAATIDHDKTDECVQKLASTTFVQTVTAAPLALISPILLLGFRARTTSTKRMCAVILNNMSKLVEDPEDAEPFLDKLLTSVEKASNEISDPEARTVCGKCTDQLKSIGDRLADPKFVSKRPTESKLKELLGNGISQYEVIVLSSLILNKLEDYDFEEALKGKGKQYFEKLEKFYFEDDEEDEDDGDAEELANCRFTLAYGSKVLLHNTKLKIKRGYKYGLLGGNDSGKTTLMRAISKEQVEGFPPASELRTVFVEADIVGELSDLPCVDYILADERIKAAGITEETVEKMLLNVGFGEMQNGARNLVTFLSGGWRMKLALARAMCLNADILLMDEPTNHLDVMNVKWVETYLLSLTNVTCIIVSHDTGLLDRVCNNIIAIDNLKLKQFKGNLTEYVAKNPKAKQFFELKSASGWKMQFPQPGFIEGVKSKGKPLMKMANCTYTYPVNQVPTVKDVTVQVSLASRVACVGPNGVGKSTMIKLLTGEVEPQEGTVWKHPNARVAYVAQHAFHHIEQHLDKTPNEYIRWRYQHGDDKEALQKDSMTLTDEEIEKCKKPFEISLPPDEKGNVRKLKWTIEKLTGGRKTVKKEVEYEVQFVGQSHDANRFIRADKLEKAGFAKHMKIVDEKVAARAGALSTPLTTANVEKHLENVGLDKEFGTHTRMAALSGGQKVKVVIAACMWNCPHIVILDEPTNYLDRDSLGALAGAIEDYDGGVVMITHNNEFCSALCPETWLMAKDETDGIARCNCKGDAEWMTKMSKKEVTAAVDQTEFTDALGNEVKVVKKTALSKKDQKKKEKLRKARKARGEVVTDTDEDEWAGFGEEEE